ncbi:MAG: peptidoglycan bridge formation glycyltransferase FemA/FemB family protein [Bacilli bacterium]|nr:peptidoglycan bridge formation glycyltransferase FemA/FemB family protein [Bacilli bacterium]
MYKLDYIEKDEYEEFVRNSSYSHFMQSYDFGQIRKEKNFNPIYIGLRKGKKLVCTALLLEKKLLLGYSYYYSPRGYIIDYNNKDLIKTFTSELKKFAKKNKAIFIKIDPAIKRHNLDIDGNVIGSDNNYLLINYLKTIGYKHLGFNIDFSKEQPRFTYKIDIDKDIKDVLKGMHPTTRKILNKNNQYNLDIYKGDINDIEDFYITMKETSKREGILQANINYYKNFYEIFNKDNLSDLYIVKANIKKLKDTIKANINDINNRIDNLSKNKDKNKGKINDLNNKVNKLNKELDEIKSIKEKEVVLSSIITVKYKDTVWTVHGGNNSKLMRLNGNYECYWKIIKDANSEGYKYVDCFGTCGIANPDKSNPIYGIHSFKKRLGGEYIELIGEFDLITNKLLYFVYKRLIPIYRKIKRKKVIKDGTSGTK